MNEGGAPATSRGVPAPETSSARTNPTTTREIQSTGVKMDVDARQVAQQRLPDELWEKILEKIVGEDSVVAFGCSCKQLRRVLRGSERRRKNETKQSEGFRTAFPCYDLGGFDRCMLEPRPVRSRLDRPLIPYTASWCLWARTLVAPRDSASLRLLVHCAAYHGHVSVLEHMKAEIHAKNLVTQDAFLFAALGGQTDVVVWLAQFHVVLIETFANNYLIPYAATQGHLRFVRWAIEQGFGWDAGAIEGACKGGKLDVVKYCLENGCPMPPPSNSAFAVAAYNGCTDILEYLYDKGFDNLFKWDNLVTSCAAMSGHLEVIKWLRERGCPWNSRTLEVAAVNGDWDILRWAHANGCPWEEDVCASAAEGGNLDMLKWLRSQDPPCPWDETTCNKAAQEGQLHIMKWADENGADWDFEAIANAAHFGHWDVIKWAREQGVEWDEMYCSEAAAEGRFDVLRRLRDGGCPWDGEALRFAVENGRYEIAKYIVKSEGSPPLSDNILSRLNRAPRKSGYMAIARLLVESGALVSKEALLAAAEAGHVDLAEYLRDVGCPWDEEVCHHAAKHNNLEVLQFLRSQDPPCPWNAETCAEAATQGSYNCLKWAHQNGCPWDETAAYGAAMKGRAKTLAYCVEEGCPHDVDECISRARASGKEGLADYLCLREELGAEIEEDLTDIFLEELGKRLE